MKTILVILLVLAMIGVADARPVGVYVGKNKVVVAARTPNGVFYRSYYRQRPRLYVSPRMPVGFRVTGRPLVWFAQNVCGFTAGSVAPDWPMPVQNLFLGNCAPRSAYYFHQTGYGVSVYPPPYVPYDWYGEPSRYGGDTIPGTMNQYPFLLGW